MLASALNVLLLPFPTMWLILLSEHDHIHPIYVNTKSHIAVKFEVRNGGHCTSSNICSTLYTTDILSFIVVYTMFTFSIVVIDIGVLYLVQVIGGGLCPLHKLLGGLAPYAPFLRLSMLHT